MIPKRDVGEPPFLNSVKGASPQQQAPHVDMRGLSVDFAGHPGGMVLDCFKEIFCSDTGGKFLDTEKGCGGIPLLCFSRALPHNSRPRMLICGACLLILLAIPVGWFWIVSKKFLQRYRRKIS